MTAVPPWVRLRCPDCHAALRSVDATYRCGSGHTFPVISGVPQLMASTARLPPTDYVDMVREYYGVPFTPRQQRKTERLVAEFVRRTRPGAPVLDVGCGRAEKSRLFPPGMYVGIDPIDPIAAGIVDRLPAPVLRATGEHLPFDDGQFAATLIFGVIEHVDDRDAVFRECARVLRPGGALCMLNQVVARGGNKMGGLLRWAWDRLRDGDVRGILAISRFTYFSGRVRRFTRILTVEEIEEGLRPHFREIERTVIDRHVLVLRALK